MQRSDFVPQKRVFLDVSWCLSPLAISASTGTTEDGGDFRESKAGWLGTRILEAPEFRAGGSIAVITLPKRYKMTLVCLFFAHIDLGLGLNHSRSLQAKVKT